MNQKYIIVSIAVFVILGLGAWVIRATSLPGPNQIQSKNQSLNDIGDRLLEVTSRILPANTHDGERLYIEHCASCHGKDLEGEPNWKQQNPDGSLKAPPHDDSGHTWHHDDQTLFDYTKKGGKVFMEEAGITTFRSGMPAFGRALSDQEITDISTFIKSRWSERSLQVQRQRTEAAKAVGGE